MPFVEEPAVFLRAWTSGGARKKGANRHSDRGRVRHSARRLRGGRVWRTMREAAEMFEDLADHGRIENEGNDLHLGRAIGAAERVTFEHFLDQARPGPRREEPVHRRCAERRPRGRTASAAGALSNVN